MHGIEIKRDAGRLAPSQRDFGAQIERAGGGYHVCQGLNETIACLFDLQVFRPEVKFRFAETDGKVNVK
jgi:hypothetical protein